MKSFAVFGLFLCSLIGSGFGAELVLNEGDCWSYDTRAGEEDSFIVIRKIEMVPSLGEVIHVSIYGIKLKNPLTASGYQTSMLMLSFSGGPLRASLKERIIRKIPEDEWRFAYHSLSEKVNGHQPIPILEPVKEHLSHSEKTMQSTTMPTPVGGGLAAKVQVTQLTPVQIRRMNFSLTMAKVRAGDPAGQEQLDAILWEYKSRPFERTPLETLELIGFHYLSVDGVEKSLPKIVTMTAVGWYDALRFASESRRDELANVESFFTRSFLVASDSAKREVRTFFRQNPARAKQLIAEGFAAAEHLRHDARLDHHWLEHGDGGQSRLGEHYELPRQRWPAAWEETKVTVTKKLEAWVSES